MLNFRKDTISSAVQPNGYEYSAIQNILYHCQSRQTMPRDGMHSLGVDRVRRAALRLRG